MRILYTLLIISILGNLFGAFVLYKYFQKDKTLQATFGILEDKTRALEEVNRRLDPRLVFVHHSVGRNWLNDGLRDSLIARGIAVRSVTRGAPLGEETDMCHWVPKFREGLDQIIRFDQPPAQPLAGSQENRIIMFKSCYPNSNITAGDEGAGSATDAAATLANYRAVMAELEPLFAEHDTKQFVYVTAPPLVADKTTPENAARARHFNEWMKTDFLAQYRERTGKNNLLVFDLFDVLADPSSNTLKTAYQRGPGDSHPNLAGNRAATTAFMAFLDQHGIE